MDALSGIFSGKSAGGDTNASAGAKPDTGAGTVQTPAPAPPVAAAAGPKPMSSWISYGVPALAGVVSAASPAGARGIQGASHVLAAMHKDTDPWGIKAQTAQQKDLAIKEHQTKQETAKEEATSQQRLRDYLVKENPQHEGLIKSVAGKDLHTFASKLMEPISFNEYSMMGQKLNYGPDSRKWTPSQSGEVHQGVMDDRLAQAHAGRQDAAQVRIDMPAPSRGGGGAPGGVFTINPETGLAEPVLGPDNKPLSAKGNKVITGTTAPERAEKKTEKEFADEKKATEAAERRLTKDARDNVKSSMDFKVGTVEKQRKMIADEKARLKKETGAAAPPAATQTVPAPAPQLTPEQAKKMLQERGQQFE